MLIPPKVGWEAARTRTRHMVQEDHVCAQAEAAVEAWKLERRAAKWEALCKPTPEEINRAFSVCHLPKRALPGLAALKRTPDNERAIQGAERLLKQFQTSQRGRGLYLHGPLGTGKTAIFMALAFDLFRFTGCFSDALPFELRSLNRDYETRGIRYLDLGRDATPQFWTVPDWFATINQAMDDSDLRGRLHKIEHCDALLLDDIGKQYDTAHKIAELFRVVNARYAECRSTSFTSNYSLPELARRMVETLGPSYASDVAALVDRIRETCDVVELKGKSWRGAAQ